MSHRVLACLASALVTCGLTVTGQAPAQSAGSQESTPWWGSVTSVPNGFDIYGMATTSDDTPVVAGAFSGTRVFPTGPNSSVTLTSENGSDDIYIAALSNDDTYYSWAIKTGGVKSQSARAIVADSDDTLYVLGNFTESATFPSGPNTSITLSGTSAFTTDIFVAAMDLDTKYFTWAQAIGDSSWYDYAYAIALIADDTPVIGGQFKGTAYFRTSAEDSIALSSATEEGFVAALKPGQPYFAWTTAVGGTTGLDLVSDLAVDADGTVIVGGQFGGTASFPRAGQAPLTLTTAGSDGFVASVTSGAGSFTWAQAIGGSSSTGVQVAVNSSGAVLVGGGFSNTITLPSSGPGLSLTSMGRTDAFIAGMDRGSSQFRWAQRAGSLGWDGVMEAAFTRDDTLVVIGTMTSATGGTGYFPDSDDSIALTSAGDADYWIGGIARDDTVFAWAQRAGSVDQDTSAARVTVLSNGVPVAGMQFSGRTAYFPRSQDDSYATSGAVLAILGPYPPRTRPGPPLSPTASAGNASAVVSWAQPTSAGSHAIASYEVQSVPAGGSCTAAAPALTCTVTGLGNGTPYTFRVRAASVAGDSDWSAASNSVTPLAPPPAPSPPGPPYLLTAEPGNRQVTLTWAPPDWSGTSPVTAYRVYAAPGGLACTTTMTTCTVTGFTNGQPYEFWVTAINTVGESAPSRRLTATPKPDPPGAPFLATVTGGNAQATVEWDAPASDGGAPVTEYRVFTGSGTRVCTVAALTEQCTATGLTNGQRYEFWVTAVNSAGESAPSRRLSVIPALALPGAPLDVAGTAGDKRIHWAWKPPESEGSYPVERYQVILSPLLPTVGGIACTVAVPETSCTVAKLTPGTTYTARVRAWSKAGWGPWSTPSTGITVPLPPPPGISVEVRRLAKDPDEVRVKGRTQGIKPGTDLWVWIHRETEYGYLESFQGTARPVVDEDGNFTWERSAPEGRIWEVIWCTQPNVKGICSRWTLL